MKKLALNLLTYLLATCVLACCATVQPPPQNPNAWVNVVDPATNHIVAGVDLQTGKVNYYSSTDEAFKAVFNSLMSLNQNFTCTPKPKDDPKAKADEKKPADKGSKKKDSK